MADYIFIGEYFATIYWPVGNEYWQVIIALTQNADCRTFLVPTEDREYEVELECRTYTVPREPRLFDE